MRLLVFVSLIAFAAPGCTHRALERNSLNQVGTVSDMRYRLVMENLAVVAAQPSALPFHSVISGGGTTVNDSRGLSTAAVINAVAFDNQSVGIDGRRDVTENWTLDPVFEPEKLAALRCAYQWAVCGPESASAECMEELKRFGVLKNLSRIPHGWLSVGNKRDVPKGACYTADWKGKAVWVAPGGMEALSQFTLVIQDIATTDLNTLGPPTKTVTEEKYEYNDKNQVKSVTKTTRVVEDAAETAPPAQPGTPSKMRLDFRGSDTRLRTLQYMNNRSGGRN